MDPLVLLALAVAGLLVGFVSGLVGIGGGVLIIPLLYLFYAHPEWSGAAIPAELHTYIANATSLFVVVPTAMMGARSYTKAGLVVWRVVFPIAIASIAFAVLGTLLALMLPGNVIRICFALFLFFTGAQLLRRKPNAAAESHVHLSIGGVVLTGMLVGVLSGLLGIGGGAIASALLIQLLGLDLKQAAATSLAIVGFAAIATSAAYAWRGWGTPGMPPGSIGYVHVAAALPIMAGSLVSVRWGSVANQRMDVRTLRFVFSAFFILLGVYIITRNVG